VARQEKTSRKVSHRATVAWCKRNIFKEISTREKCGSQKRLALPRRGIWMFSISKNKASSKLIYLVFKILEEDDINSVYNPAPSTIYDVEAEKHNMEK
jgi:hypothetical protein